MQAFGHFIFVCVCSEGVMLLWLLNSQVDSYWRQRKASIGNVVSGLKVSDMEQSLVTGLFAGTVV